MFSCLSAQGSSSNSSERHQESTVSSSTGVDVNERRDHASLPDGVKEEGGTKELSDHYRYTSVHVHMYICTVWYIIYMYVLYACIKR